MPVWLLAEGRAVDVWGVRHLLPANRQADRVALYRKALCFLLFFSCFVWRWYFFFCRCTPFFWGNGSRDLGVILDLRKGGGSLWWSEQRQIGVLYFNTLEFSVGSINTPLVVSHKWERYGLVVTQSFEDHHDVFLEKPSDALEMCQILLHPGSLERFIVGRSPRCPFMPRTAVICAVSMPSAISGSTRYSHQCTTKQSYPDVNHQDERQLNYILSE